MENAKLRVNTGIKYYRHIITMGFIPLTIVCENCKKGESNFRRVNTWGHNSATTNELNAPQQSHGFIVFHCLPWQTKYLHNRNIICITNNILLRYYFKSLALNIVVQLKIPLKF